VLKKGAGGASSPCLQGVGGVEGQLGLWKRGGVLEGCLVAGRSGNDNPQQRGAGQKGGSEGGWPPVECVDEHVDGLLELPTVLVVGLETTVDANLSREVGSESLFPTAGTVAVTEPCVGLERGPPRQAATARLGTAARRCRNATAGFWGGGRTMRVRLTCSAGRRSPGAAPPRRRVLGWP